MSSLIKSRSLRKPRLEEEFLVDPARPGHRRKGAGRSAEDAAHSILEAAREQAAGILAAARLEAESIRADASRQVQEWTRKRMEEFEQAAEDALSSTRADAGAQVEQFWNEIEPEVVKLAVAVARKVTRREIDLADGFVLETVKAAIQQLRDRRELRIHVNPADYELAHQRKEEIVCSYDGVNAVEIVSDRRVDVGGCTIESANGHLDGRIETQLAEAERAMLEAAHDGR